MSWYDSYINRITIDGNNEQEIIENIWTEDFEYYFERAGNKKTMFINNTDIEYEGLLKDNSKSKSIYDEKILLSRKNSLFKVGDFFSWFNNYWLIITEDIRVVNSLKKFFVSKCTSKLNGINPDGKIFSYPCVRKLSSGLSVETNENKHIELLDGSASIKVQSNKDTKEIKIGDRFIFSKTESYSVKNIYTELEEGIITLKMKQYEINKDLDKEIDYQGKKIWIANYVNRPKFTINFNTQDSEFQIGEDITLDYTLLDNEGNISDKPVIFSSSDDNIVSITNNIATAVSLGSVIIKVEMENNSDIYDEITLEVVNTPIENISYEINPDVSVLLRQQSQNFDIVKKNNGVVESETFTISVDSSSTVIEDYDFNVINSNSFNIVNNGTSGSLVIKIIPDSKPSDIFTKSFELKNSFW